MYIAWIAFWNGAKPPPHNIAVHKGVNYQFFVQWIDCSGYSDGWKTGKSYLCAVCTTMLCGGGFTPIQKAIHDIYVLSMYTLLYVPLCLFSCILCWEEVVKRLSHRVHGKGFSPVCVRMCSSRFPFCVNRFEQWAHWKGLSPSCNLMCWINDVL